MALDAAKAHENGNRRCTKLFRGRPASACSALASFNLTRRAFTKAERSFSRQIRPPLSHRKPQIPILLVAFGMPSASRLFGTTML
jgi:hypothetical protein